MFSTWRKNWHKKRLKEARFAFLFDKAPDNEYVCLDCETTGLNPKTDEIISIAAVRIKDNAILHHERLELMIKHENISQSSIKVHMIRDCDTQQGLDIHSALEQLLAFIGSRPIVGYYTEFDVAMINKYLKPWLGIKLPNEVIETSALYHDWKIDLIPQKRIDLKFDTILDDLGLPKLAAHNAYNDVLMTAMIFLSLKNQK